MDEDIKFLKQTLKLAKKGIGWVNPNPMVGAILVKKGRIIGKGYHKRVGLPHAEIEALKSCKTDPKGATLYVNLEPCIHFGKTPPCVDTIIQSGIKRIVISTVDPNPKVYGRSLKKLQQANIDVSVGILENEARKLNEAFFTFHERKRPFVAIKFAASLDGKIATSTGDSKWITNEKARIFARSLRGEYQAILVGVNTLIKDDPHLGVRIRGKKDPVRVIISSGLRLSPNIQVFRDQNFMIVNTKNVSALLSILREKEIISILVEGGGKTLGNFCDAKVVDKVYTFHAPILIGGEKAISAIGGQGSQFISQALHLKNLSYRRFDDNLLTIGYVV